MTSGCRMMGGQRAGELHGDKVQETSRNHLPEMWLRRCSSGPRPESSRSTLQSLGIPGRPVQRLRPQVSRPALWISEGEMGEMPPLATAWIYRRGIRSTTEFQPGPRQRSSYAPTVGAEKPAAAISSVFARGRGSTYDRKPTPTTIVGQTDTPNSELRRSA